MLIQKIESCHNKRNSLVDVNAGISIIDILIILGFIWTIITKHHFLDTDSFTSTKAVWEVKQIGLNALLFIYILMRFITNGTKRNYLTIIGIVGAFIIMSYELKEGIKQIVEDLINSYPISINGTFLNSGPYGGMLSLCLCTLSPYLFNLYLKKVTKGLVYIVVIPCLLMILFSLSRSAWLAVCVCFVIMYLRKYPKEKKKRISILAFVVFLCGCSYLVKKESADGRFLMNKIAISSIANNNIWGAGIGLYCGSYAESSYEFFKVDKGEAQIESLPKINHEKSRNVAGAPFDAFNEYLRAGVELGVPGLLILLLVSGLSLYVLFSINSTFRYGLLSLLIFALFSYPFSLPVFQVFFVFFLAIASTSAKKLLNGKSALFLGILLLLTSGLSFFKSYPYYRNISRCEKEWKEYDELYNLGFFLLLMIRILLYTTI